MKKLFFNIILLLALILTFCTSILAVPQSFESDGHFVMGDNNTKIQARHFALQDAKRMALEQAGTYLSSIKQVTDGRVSKDDITVIAAGVIKLEAIVSEELKLDNDIMVLSIKARFLIDDDDLQRKIDAFRQGDNRKPQLQKQAESDLQKRYNSLLAENNRLKTQLAQTNDQKIKKQLLLKTKEIEHQLTVTQWFDKGLEYYNRENFDGAIDAYSKAIQLNPRYAEAYNNRAIAYASKGQDYLAISDYTKAIQMNPQYAEAYCQRAIAYANKRQYDLAIANLTKSIQLNPQDAYSYYNRAIVYVNKDRYDLALADIDKALELAPKNQRYTDVRNAILKALN